MKPFVSAILILFASLPTFAQVTEKDSLVMSFTGAEILVSAEKNELFHGLPGSMTYIPLSTLKQLAPISGNEVFRLSPGVHVVDEEGTGLRVNIGIRGLDPDRSRGVLILEDGIPVALAPYGEPEMYYTPAMERMNGIEILKGSGQILYGPQTIGGVINYLTADPPASRKGYINLKSGQGGLFNIMAGIGNTHNQTGYQVNYLHKQADRVGYAGYQIHDLNAKIQTQLSAKSRLTGKIAFYDEWSDATYVGLNQVMYERGDQDYVRMAPNDQLTIRRYAASLQHHWNPGDNHTFKTTLYGYTTTRNWKRQDFSLNPQSSNQTGVIWGDPSIENGAIYMRSGTGNRNRQFEVAGLESNYRYDYILWGHRQSLVAGGRLLYERAFEQRVNGKNLESTSGQLISDEIRTGQAVSAYIQNNAQASSRLSFTTGLRMEWFDYNRQILRNSFQGVVLDTLITAGRNIGMLIPGLGANYLINTDWTLFAGVHRGFAPPRTKDAITAAGETLDLEAETSWNSELGFRKRLKNNWRFESTLFMMDFSNQIIPVSESSGGTGTGLVNGGATQHYGIEIGGHWIINLNPVKTHTLELGSNLTLIEAIYLKDRFISTGEETINIKGNSTPYAPNLLSHSTLLYQYKEKFGMQASVLVTSEQFTDELNTIIPTADGLVGKIDGYKVINLNSWYQFEKLPFRVGLSVHNLLDERYIATRRPQGIRLGLPRFVSGTLNWNF